MAGLRLGLRLDPRAMPPGSTRWSGDFRCIEVERNRQIACAARLLGDAADAFAPLQLLPDLLRSDLARDPKHDQMVEHIGTLGDDGVTVAGDRLDQALHSL